MRLGRKRTWSQQQLAKRLHLDARANSGLLTWERRHLVIHAAKTALAAGLCWWLAVRLALHDAYWGAISAIIVLQSNFGSTITASRDRLLGTLIGAAFGFSFSLFGTLPWNYLLAVLAAVTSVRTAWLSQQLTPRRRHHHDRNVGITKRISLGDRARPRGAGSAGHLVALAVSTLVFPDRARLRLRDGLAQEFLMLGALFEAILRGFRGAPADILAAAREDMHWPCCAATMNCLRRRAMSLLADPDGARD